MFANILDKIWYKIYENCILLRLGATMEMNIINKKCGLYYIFHSVNNFFRDILIF